MSSRNKRSPRPPQSIVPHPPTEGARPLKVPGPLRGLAPSASKGFSLVEVLIAILILATGLVSITQGLARTQQGLKISQNLVRVSQVAEEKMTETELELYKDKKLSTSHDQGIERLPGLKIDWDRNVGAYTGKGIEDETKLNQVNLTLNWTEGVTRKNKMVLSTILINRPDPEEEAPAP